MSYTNFIENGTIANLEPTPLNVKYGTRYTAPTVAPASESAALYVRVAPTTQQVGLYMEMTSDQIDTQGACIKIIHKGSGDAVFVAAFASGPAIETASFYNGSRGFISTNQWEGSNTSARDFGNTTLFQGVWGDDGTGGSTTPANYGMFYAARSLGNSFRTRLQDPAATGWAWGRAEWSISSFDLATNHFAVYNQGTVETRGRVATSSFHYEASPVKLIGSYWNGSAAVEKEVALTPVLYGGDGSVGLTVKCTGTEVLRADLAGLGVGLSATPTAGLDVNIGDSIRVRNSQTPATAGATGLVGEIAWDANYLYVCTGTNSWKRIGIATW